MAVAIRVYREGNGARLVPTGTFDLGHTMAATRLLPDVKARLHGCVSVDVDLAELEQIDGTGAALLAQLLDRLDADGLQIRVTEGPNPEAARLLALSRQRGRHLPIRKVAMQNLMARIGKLAMDMPQKATEAFDFTGRCAAALPRAAATPRSLDWASLPRLVQEVGADALPVTSAANLLVGVIIGFLGISQLEPFGALSKVPALVVVAHFRELGPLVTAIVVAGRSGAGLASELATMKVSEEIDAFRTLGFDPVRWLVVPRCFALIVTLPLLTWIGDLLALLGGMFATTTLTSMSPRTYLALTANNVTVTHLFVSLTKPPFLALAIGLVACGHGLATRGGAAAVGRRTTTAVVQSIFAVILISAVFTFFFALIGV
jgi:phospholipid/cholesterol/gamma-HCH transport system permease protein